MAKALPMTTTEHSSEVAANDKIHRSTLDRPKA